MNSNAGASASSSNCSSEEVTHSNSAKSDVKASPACVTVQHPENQLLWVTHSNSLLSENTVSPACVADQHPENNSQWVSINRKKKSANDINVLGTGPLTETIKVASVTRKELYYLSYFDPSTSTEQVMDFVQKTFGFKSPYCVKLLKTDADIGLLNFVFFKMAVPPEQKAKFVCLTSWPTGILVKKLSQNIIQKTQHELK